MPRKAKKDKVIAKLRRQVASQGIRSGKREAGREVSVRNEKKEKLKRPSPLPTSKPTRLQAPEHSDGGQTPHLSSSSSLLSYPVDLIKKDLTKTLALTILAISLELGIYYLLKLEVLPLR